MGKKMSSFYSLEQTIITTIVNGYDISELEAKTKGFNYNNFVDGETLIARLAFEGELETMEYILSKGADPNIVSKTLPFCSGPALLYALQNNNSKPERKAAIVKALINAGANVNARVDWIDNDKKKYKENLTAFGLHDYMDLLGYYFKEDSDASDRRYGQNQIKGLQGMLRVMKDAGAEVPAGWEESYQKLMEHKTKRQQNMVSAKAMYDTILQKLQVDNPIYNLPQIAQSVCIEEMTDPEFIKSPEWADLVKYLVDHSLLYENVCMEIYGEVPDDDGGGVFDSWGESFSWYTELMEVLCSEKASENPNWESVFEYALNNAKTYNAWIVDVLDDLLSEDWFIEHPIYNRVNETISRLC